MPKPFEQMSREEKVVAIAEDVLKHLDDTQAVQSTYCSGEIHVDSGVTSETQLQSIEQELTRKCQVCALGACFLSHIRLFDNITFKDVDCENIEDLVANDDGYIVFDIPWRAVYKPLSEYFDRDNLLLIETAFERDKGFSELSGIEADAAELFGRRYSDPRERLRAIMENIIKHNGTFTIPQDCLNAAEGAAFNQGDKDAHRI